MLARLALHLVESCEDSRDRSEAVDQLDGTLLADALDAGDVVGGIAHDGQHVDHVLRSAPELLPDCFVTLDQEVDPWLEDVVDLHAVADELHEVLVAGDQHDLPAECFGLSGEGADHIVGLEAGDLEDGDSVRAHDGAQVVELVDQLLGHALAGRLVVGELPVPKGLPGRIEGHGDALGLLLFE